MGGGLRLIVGLRNGGHAELSGFGHAQLPGRGRTCRYGPSRQHVLDFVPQVCSVGLDELQTTLRTG